MAITIGGMTASAAAIVSIAATLEPSGDDPKFGWFKRPTKASAARSLGVGRRRLRGQFASCAKEGTGESSRNIDNSVLSLWR